MNQNEHAVAFIQQTANDPALSPNSIAVAAVMAATIIGYQPVAATSWHKVWQASGFPRAEGRNDVGELIASGHIGQRREGWIEMQGFTVRLATIAVTA